MLATDRQDSHPYSAKIAECYALCDASDDPLVRAVYQAMAIEFEGRAGQEATRADPVHAGTRGMAMPRLLPQPRFVPQAR